MERAGFPNGFLRRGEPVCGHFDEVRFLDTLVRDADGERKRRIPRGCSLFVRGWAYNPSPPRPATAVLAWIDESFAIDVAYGRSRPDIALNFGVPELGTCGFQAMYPLGDLALGAHGVTLATLDGDGGYYVLPQAERFEIVPSRELFPGVARSEEGRMNVSVDGFSAMRSGAIPSGGTLLVERGDIVYVRGWAIDTAGATGPHGVFAIVDDDEYVMGVHGLPREDVARTVRLPGVVRCGFTLRIPTRGLRSGPHRLQIAALAPDETYGLAAVGTIEVA